MMMKSRHRLSAGCYSRPGTLSTLGLEGIGDVILSGGEAGASDLKKADCAQAVGKIGFNVYPFSISRSAG
jgi:hypothetical protein